MDKTHEGDYRSAVSNTDERVTEGHSVFARIPDACDAHALLREGVAARPMSCVRRILHSRTPERTLGPIQNDSGLPKDLPPPFWQAEQHGRKATEGHSFYADNS